MSPAQAQGRSGKLYRYYVSSPLQRGQASTGKGDPNLRRVSGPAIESVVSLALERLLPDETDRHRQLRRAELRRRDLVLALPARYAKVIRERLAPGESIAPDSDSRKAVLVTIPIAFASRGTNTIVSIGAPSAARPDPALISALRRAHSVMQRDRHGPILTEAPQSQYARRIAGLALLAPDIQRDILLGKQPPLLSLSALISTELPLDWNEQRSVLGWR